MNIIYYILLFFPILKLKGFIFSNPNLHSIHNNIHHFVNNKIGFKKLILSNNNKNTNEIHDKNTIITTFFSKSKSFLNIIRYENIFPTLLLSFSGGFITNKSVLKILKNPDFMISTVNTILIMSSSMILNDLFDINIDKKNKKNRPLVNGEMTVKEALIYSAVLLGLTEYLSYKYLPYYLQMIMNFSIVNIIIYTPILKRILFIKNLSCSFLVSFSIMVGGLASTTINNISNFNLLMMVSNMVFFGSLHNEILMDISDYSGDKENNILTVPIAFGKENAYKIVSCLTKFFILSNSVFISMLFNYKLSLPFFLIFYRLIFNLKKIKNHQFSNKIIEKVVKETNIPLFLSILYFCLLSIIKK